MRVKQNVAKVRLSPVAPGKIKCWLVFEDGRIARFFIADFDHTKNCKSCGEEFTAKDLRQVYCRRPCLGRGQGTGHQAWRTAVLERDGYRCVVCGSLDNPEADHIKPQALYPELRRVVSNGRILCRTCHIQTPTYGSKARILTAVHEEPANG